MKVEKRHGDRTRVCVYVHPWCVLAGPPGSFQLNEQGLAESDQEQSWLRQDPLVECGPEAMRLRIRRRRAGQLLLDRGKGLPLNHCGVLV